MQRRTFCKGIGSALLASGIRTSGAAAFAQTASAAAPDADPAGGFNPAPPSLFLFTDYRNISVGDIGWMTPEGKTLPVAGPPDPPVPAIAKLGMVARGIRLVAQPARKEGPVAGLPGRLSKEGDLYRSWGLRVSYGTGQDLGSYSQATAQSMMVTCSESKDGYAWTSRQLNEIKPPEVTGIDGEYFFVDPHAPAEERYKCIYNARLQNPPAELWAGYQKIHPRHRDVRIQAERIYCLFGLTSADGLHWRAIPEPLTVHYGDTDNTVYWDEWLGKYVLYTRLYWMDRRMVARAESDDFRHWTPVEPILWPSLADPLSYDIYTNGRTAYPGLPGQHLMFPFCYQRYTQQSEVHLHSSIDGLHWQRVPGGPVLRPGDPGAWDGEFIVAGKSLVPLGSDRVAIPYSGSTHPHKYPRWPGVITGGAGWASWPRGRLAGLVADEAGEFATFPVQVKGRALRLNARVHRAGELRVGLVNIEKRSVDSCDVVLGDNLAHPVTWKGESTLNAAPGSSVVLHFRLRAAELFAFEWVS